MNEKLQKELSMIESLISTQKDCIVAGDPAVDYMHGMANGMILVHSMVADTKPKFVTRPRRAYNRIVRHKCVRSKRGR